MRTRALLIEFGLAGALVMATTATTLGACATYDADSGAADAGGNAEDAQSQSADGALSQDTGVSDGSVPGDGGGATKCDPDGVLGPPVPLATLKPMHDGPLAGMSFTADELRVYYAQGGVLYTATRASTSSDFGNLTALPLPVGISYARHPVVSGDGASLAFASRTTVESIIVATLTSPTTIGKFLTLGNDSVNSLRAPAPLPKAVPPTFFAISSPMPDDPATGELVSIINGHVSPVLVPTLTASAPVFTGDGQRLYVSYSTLINGAKTRVVGVMKPQGGGTATSWSAPTPLPTIATPLPAFPAWGSADHCRLYVLSGDSESGSPYILQRAPK